MLVLALAGCAVREGWVRQGMTDEQVKADLYECERDWRAAKVGAWLFTQCMEAKGYRQK